MSNEPEMSDAQFTNVFSIMIGGLIVLTVALIILAIVVSSGVRQSNVSATVRDAKVAERIQPVGQIAIGEEPQTQTASAATSGSQETGMASGESVYQNTCSACHASGVAGAPVFGNSEAWADRIAKGKETLYQHALNGFQGDAGVMPAKGGNSGLSDEEVKAAVDHMVDAAK